MTEPEQNISALLTEHRVFEPPAEFTANALVKDRSVYEHAETDYEGFWAEQAERLTWFKKWDTVLEWTPPWAKWFVGGSLNATYNCLDRHVEAGGGDKVAYYWEGEPGDERAITYRELLEEVCRFANALKSLGVPSASTATFRRGCVTPARNSRARACKFPRFCRQTRHRRHCERNSSALWASGTPVAHAEVGLALAGIRPESWGQSL